MKKFSVLGGVLLIGLIAGCQSQSGSSSHINLADLRDQVAQEQKLNAEETKKRNQVRAQMLDAQKVRVAKQKAKVTAALEKRKKRIEEIRAKLKKKNSATTVAVVNSAPEKKTKKGGRYNSLIAKYAAAENVPLKLAHAVVFVESSYRASATGSVGEIGLMQIRPATARLMGYRGSSKALYDPATNLKWGMKYLGKARKLAGGDTCGTILRYNAGHGAKRMNKISSRYCGRVKKIMRG